MKNPYLPFLSIDLGGGGLNKKKFTVNFKIIKNN